MRDLQLNFFFYVAGHLYFGQGRAMSQLCCEILYARPRRRFEREHRFEQRPEARWNASCLQLFEGKHVRFLSTANFFNATATKWRFPGERKPERGPEGINVRAYIDWAALELFRARKIRCADEFSMRQVHFTSGIRDGLGQPEVDDFHFQFRRLSVTSRQHDIARLEVAMDQTLGRGSHQCPRNLDRNLQSQLCTERTIPPHASLQCLALDEFHCVIAAAAIRRSTELENGSHIWMPQGSRGTRFTQKTFAHSL